MGIPSAKGSIRAPSEYMKKGKGIEDLENKIEQSKKDRSFY